MVFQFFILTNSCLSRPSDPFINAFYGHSCSDGQTSIPVDLKGTQAILCAKTPDFTSEKQSLPGNVPDRDFCHVTRLRRQRRTDDIRGFEFRFF